MSNFCDKCGADLRSKPNKECCGEEGLVSKIVEGAAYGALGGVAATVAVEVASSLFGSLFGDE